MSFFYVLNDDGQMEHQVAWEYLVLAYATVR